MQGWAGLGQAEKSGPVQTYTIAYTLQVGCWLCSEAFTSLPVWSGSNTFADITGWERTAFAGGQLGNLSL